jgi:hypothetical protein
MDVSSDDVVVPKKDDDPLKKVPEALIGKDADQAPLPTLPDISFPQEPEVVDILDDILGDGHFDQFATESREEERLDVMKETLKTLKEMVEVMKQNGHLLTMLNTGVRKNTMVLDDIADMERRRQRENRWRRETPTLPRRHSAVRSTVKRVRKDRSD